MSEAKTISIEIPPPHGDIQRQIMTFFSHPYAEELFICCGTKFGKTFSCGAAMALSAPALPSSRWGWSAPVYRQSKIGFDLIRKLLPEQFIKPNKSELTIGINGINTDMFFVHGKDPEKTIEGDRVDGWVIDEASKQKPDVYASIRTTVTHTRSLGRGKIIAPSTPLGKNNWFYKKCMAAKLEMEQAAYEGRHPKSLFLTAPTAANPHIAKEVIDEARRTLPERLFKQYYEAKFIDDGDIFQNVSACLFGQEITTIPDYYEIFDPKADQYDVVIGADWARKPDGDYTVFVAVAYGHPEGPRVVGFHRSRGLNFTQQIANLYKFSKRFYGTTLILHDMTGMGTAIEDQLRETDLPTEGVNFSMHSKAEMATKLITSLEQKRLLMPNIKVIRDELEAYQLTITEHGNMLFAAPIGMNDDCVAALMLVNAGMLRFVDTSSAILLLDQLSPLQSYYDELIEDSIWSEGEIFTDSEKGLMEWIGITTRPDIAYLRSKIEN